MPFVLLILLSTLACAPPPVAKLQAPPAELDAGRAPRPPVVLAPRMECFVQGGHGGVPLARELLLGVDVGNPNDVSITLAGVHWRIPLGDDAYEAPLLTASRTIAPGYREAVSIRRPLSDEDRSLLDAGGFWEALTGARWPPIECPHRSCPCVSSCSHLCWPSSPAHPVGTSSSAIRTRATLEGG
jgi:hypothetical protein